MPSVLYVFVMSILKGSCMMSIDVMCSFMNVRSSPVTSAGKWSNWDSAFVGMPQPAPVFKCWSPIRLHNNVPWTILVTSHHRRCPTQVNRWISQGGVREDDIILEVNGIETAGKDRCLDVKFGIRKQDIKTNLQVVTSWFWWSIPSRSPSRNIQTIPYQLCHQMNHMPSTFVGKPEISIPFPRLRCCAAALLEGKATGAQVVQTKGRHQGEMGGNQDTPTKDGRTKKQGKITMHWHICITYIFIYIYVYIYIPSYTCLTYSQSRCGCGLLVLLLLLVV